MSSINVILPGQDRKIVMVYIPPDGEPKPCYEDYLAEAYRDGYRRYEEPSAAPAAVPAGIAPEETASDKAERIEREWDEREMKLEERRIDLGLAGVPKADCATCGGTGLTADLAAPCETCYPWTKPDDAHADADGKAQVDTPPIGGDNGSAIVGAPEPFSVTVTGTGYTEGAVVLPTTAPASCTEKDCSGLCGICPPPRKVTVRQGRELNRNRRARGLDPLRIVDGIVKGRE